MCDAAIWAEIPKIIATAGFFVVAIIIVWRCL